jgi:hypothetical protein
MHSLKKMYQSYEQQKIAIGDYRNKSEAFQGINLFNGGIELVVTCTRKLIGAA